VSSGLPEAARRRLEELRRGGSAFFTSDLSTSEFLLAREAGFRPLTQVMGSSVYHVGLQQLPLANSKSGGPIARWRARTTPLPTRVSPTPGDGGFSPQEAVDKAHQSERRQLSGSDLGYAVALDIQTEAWNEARRLAVGRLAEEATLAGADAVIGVRLTQRQAFGEELVEFAAFGTAVKSERYDLGDQPVLSNLSGQDFAKLFAHGWWPAGLVAATSVTYVASGWTTRRTTRGLSSSRLRNQELKDYTWGLYDARAKAMRRLERQAHEAGGHGIVGVTYDQDVKEHEAEDANENKRIDLIATVHVTGTAVVELPGRVASPSRIALNLKET
jgi:uncharacterized protein YbjQ (UPF0145 family)